MTPSLSSAWSVAKSLTPKNFMTWRSKTPSRRTKPNRISELFPGSAAVDGGSGQAPHDHPGIVKAGCHGQGDGRVQRNRAYRNHPSCVVNLVKQHQSDGHHLGDGVELAEHTEFELPPPH